MKKLKDWYDSGYTELDWLNDVKPLILAAIRSYCKKYPENETDPLTALEDRSKTKLDTDDAATTKMKSDFVLVINEVRDWAVRHSKGDKVATMKLCNHGFLVKKKKGGK